MKKGEPVEILITCLYSVLKLGKKLCTVLELY